MVAVAAAPVIGFGWTAAPDPGTWTIGIVETKWQHFLFGPAGQLLALTLFVIVLELLFRRFACSFGAAHQRSSDLGFAPVTFSSLKRLVVFRLGVGCGEAWRCARHAYRRCELPENGILKVTGAFASTT